MHEPEARMMSPVIDLDCFCAIVPLPHMHRGQGNICFTGVQGVSFRGCHKKFVQLLFLLGGVYKIIVKDCSIDRMHNKLVNLCESLRPGRGLRAWALGSV